jgi:hypothetical protein
MNRMVADIIEPMNRQYDTIMSQIDVITKNVLSSRSKIRRLRKTLSVSFRFFLLKTKSDILFTIH